MYEWTPVAKSIDSHLRKGVPSNKDAILGLD